MRSVKARIFRRKKKKVQTQKQSKTSKKFLSRALVDYFRLYVCKNEIIKWLQVREGFYGVSNII